MYDLYVLSEVVKEVLEEDKHARESDNYLFLQVLGKILKDSQKKTIEQVLLDPELPKYESVSRARRKVQQKCPNLRSSMDVENYRKVKESVFREFAKG